jgi:hypothetical protein
MALRFVSASLAVTAMIGLSAATPATAQEEPADVAGLLCKEVMILSGPDRDTTIAFIHGYILGKAGSSTVDLDKLTDATEAFLNNCVEAPNANAIETMEAAVK